MSVAGRTRRGPTTLIGVEGKGAPVELALKFGAQFALRIGVFAAVVLGLLPSLSGPVTLEFRLHGRVTSFLAVSLITGSTIGIACGLVTALIHLTTPGSQCLCRCATQGRSVTVTNRRQPKPRLIRRGVKFGDGRQLALRCGSRMRRRSAHHMR
jgi:hypothetical protein